MAAPSGIIAVYKPKGITSHDAVALIKRRSGGAKVGHAGTLDPLAAGVLVVGIGRTATRQLHAAVRAEKEYVAVIRLGQTSSTDDEEGQKTSSTGAVEPTRDGIETVLPAFIGALPQTPPALSAIKVKGQKAYQLARRGQPVNLPPRLVELKTAEVLNYQWPDVTVRLITGPGFYVRALARDLGRRLGTGGYLADLERTRVGQFSKDAAVSLDQFR